MRLDQLVEPRTKPFCEPSAKGKCRVNPSISIVNVVPRDWEGYSHLRQRLQDTPNAAADHQICDNHVSGASGSQSLPGGNEEAATDIGSERDDLVRSVSMSRVTNRMRYLRALGGA